MSAPDLAARLGLRRAGREWRGTCPACGYTNSFSLSETREGKPLLWCASCNDRDALAALLRGTGALPPPAPARAPERLSSADRTALALADWTRARADDGTIKRYLASRGLSGGAPEDVRLMPSLKHRESGTAWPCMIAAVRDAGGTIRAIHRTWLKRDGTGKAPVEPTKKTLGPVASCAVRLAPADEAIVLAEGIETALAASLIFDLPAWACLSAGGLESVILPDRIASVLIAADADPPGTRAAETLARRLASEGRRVRIAMPNEPGTDFADTLRARKAAHG